MAVPNFLNSTIHGVFSIFGMQMGDPWHRAIPSWKEAADAFLYAARRWFPCFDFNHDSWSRTEVLVPFKVCLFLLKFVYFSSVQPHSPLLVHWFTKKWWNQSEELEKWVPLTLNETCFIMFLRKCPMKMEVFSLREPWKPSKLGDSPQNQLVLVAPFEAGMKFNWLPWLLDFRGVGGLRKLRIYVLLTW